MPERRVTAVRPAGPDHQVVTVEGGRSSYRREVCTECPWRLDTVGGFPPEAFRHSATTAYDMAMNTFACHMSGAERPAICAGFLLRGSMHNMAVRLKLAREEIALGAVLETAPLHGSYRAMATANGVEPDDPALARCRDG